MTNQRFASGILSRNRKKSGADHRGQLEVPVESIPALIEYLNTAEREDNYRGDGKVVKLQLGGWDKHGKSGPFISLALSEPWVAPPEGYRPKRKETVPAGDYSGPGMARGPEDENDGFDEPPF